MTLDFVRPDGRPAAWRNPTSKAELAWYLRTFFGLILAPTAHPDCVAAGHSAPLDVAWAIYSVTHPQSGQHMPPCIVKGSRGLSGKSTMLSVNASWFLSLPDARARMTALEGGLQHPATPVGHEYSIVE